MALPIRPMMQAAMHAARAATPYVADLAQVASAAASVHAALAGGGTPAPATAPAGMPPQPSSRNATFLRLQRQLRDGTGPRDAQPGARTAGTGAHPGPVEAEMKRMYQEARDRAEATGEAAKSVG